MIISLDLGLPPSLKRPTRRLGRASLFRSGPRVGRSGVSLFGLASDDAYRAVDVATNAVGSYPAVSPLPVPKPSSREGLTGSAIGGLFSVVQVSDYSAWALPSVPPLKSGLSSRLATSDHPYSSSAHVSIRPDGGSRNIHPPPTRAKNGLPAIRKGIILPVRAARKLTLPMAFVTVASRLGTSWSRPTLPFYCGERSAAICVVLGPKKSSMYSAGTKCASAHLGLGG